MQCTRIHTHPFNGPLSWTTRVSRYQKGKTNLDFTEAWDSEWQWYQLGRMQVCTSLQTDNHASTPPLSFLQAGCPSCRPTNSVTALKAKLCNPQTVVNRTVVMMRSRLIFFVYRYILLCGYRPFYASCGKDCGFSEGLPCEDCQVCTLPSLPLWPS